MVNSYGYSVAGIKAFAINRFLRLYPAYWFILILTFIAIVMYGEDNSSSYRKYMYLTDSIPSLFQNISLLYLDLFPNTVTPRLSPPTWALTIEIFFYLLIALSISRSKRITTIWFISSVVYMASVHALNLNYKYRYNIILAGTLPFSLGAMIFHYYEKGIVSIFKLKSNKSFLILACFFVINAAFAAIIHKLEHFNFLMSLSFYLNFLINCTIIINLISGDIPYISKSVDRKIGNMSYPIYLFHWQAGFIASMVIWGAPIRGMNMQSIISLFPAVALCILISFFIEKYIDIPIEKIRKKIRTEVS